MADYGSVSTYPATASQAEKTETAMSTLNALIDQVGSRRDYAAKRMEQTSHEANHAEQEHRQLHAIFESLVQVRERFNDSDTDRKDPRY